MKKISADRINISDIAHQNALIHNGDSTKVSIKNCSELDALQLTHRIHFKDVSTICMHISKLEKLE